MKKFLPILIAAGGIYLAIRYFRKAQTAAILNVKIRNLKLQPISQAAIVLEAINPTNTNISFTSITGDLILNDFAVATLNYQQPTTIEANNSRTINLKIKLNPVQLAAFTANRIFAKGKMQTMKFNGNISGEGLNIPINIEQPLSI